MTVELAERPTTEGIMPSKAPRLPMRSLELAEQVRREFWTNAPPGASHDDIRHPEFFVNVSKDLRRHDVIHVLANDETWQVEMIVEAVKQTSVDVSVVKKISRVGLDVSQTWLDSDHFVEYRPGKGWCAIRAKDGCALVEGQGSPEGAKHIFFAKQPKPVR